jgi:hypothetical protein
MNTQAEIGATPEQSNAVLNRASLTSMVQYNPGNLLNALIEHLGLKNDAALARTLEVAPPLISKLRHQTLPVGGAILIRMHEVSGLSISELRILLGDRRQKFRISDKQFKPKEDGTDLLN